MNKKTIDIIGAGIAGLTMAIALRQKGFPVRIFEKSNQLKHVGAGIILASNAMMIFDKLGCKEEIERKGHILDAMNITDADLELISSMDLKYFETLFGVNTIAIHRGDLQDILLNALEGVEIHLGYELKTIEFKAETMILEFENAIKESSSMLIGADGLHSKVRDYVSPHSFLRDAKQVCWRGVAEYQLPLKYQNSLYEAWGNKARFGFVQISEKEVYWYALKTFKNQADEHEVSKIDKYFINFNSTIKDLLFSTTIENIHSSRIIDLKPINNWHKGNICLIGDATHAMTPNMGQGACQSIEDAYVLADCLSKYVETDAFSAYQNIRYKKVNKIVKTSWMVGKIAHVQNFFLIKIRNFVLSKIPTSVSRKQSEEIFSLFKS